MDERTVTQHNEALFAPYKGMDWSDEKAVKTAVFKLKKVLGLKLGQTYEWLAHMQGYKTYAAMRADLKAKGVLK